MNGELKPSNKTTWLIVLLLSSPVIVQIMDMTKEAIWGPKYNHAHTTAMLEAALAELIAQRKQQEMNPMQNVVYLPVQNQPFAEHKMQQHQFQPSLPHIEPRTSLLRMQKELKEQLERVMMLHKKQGNVTSYTISAPNGAQYIIQTNQPDTIKLAQMQQKKLAEIALSQNNSEDKIQPQGELPA